MEEGMPAGQPAPGGAEEFAAMAEESLAKLAEAQPEKAEAFAQLALQLRELVQGGGEAPAGPRPAEGTATPEAGGNPNARPMSMGG